jgi:hypothetical protein
VFAPLDNGGDDVISFELQIDEGQVNSAFSDVASFATAGGDSASLLEWTLTQASDGLVTGRVYTLRFRTLNRVGASKWSDFLRVGLADQVAAPATLSADLSLSTATSATLKWSQVPNEAIDVEGYVLQMQTDADNWIDIFNAAHNSNALSTTVFGLQTAKPYRFRVFAVDFNGRSEPSPEFQIYACGLPRFMSPPQYVDSTQTTITIRWRAP